MTWASVRPMTGRKYYKAAREYGGDEGLEVRG
jgi:hypothetical protein